MNEIAGSAIGAKTAPEVNQDAALIDGKLASRYEDIKDIDQVHATKYPEGDNSIAYLADGTISVQKSDGKFVVSNNSSRKTPGAIRADQSQGTFVSTATEMKIGSETVKTLTGLIMNPSLVFRPSSNITPEKLWLKSLFPILTDSDSRAVFQYRLIQAALFSILAKIDPHRPYNATYEQHRTYKDLGTMVIENQEFERRILEGKIKN